VRTARPSDDERSAKRDHALVRQEPAIGRVLHRETRSEFPVEQLADRLGQDYLPRGRYGGGEAGLFSSKARTARYPTAVGPASAPNGLAVPPRAPAAARGAHSAPGPLDRPTRRDTDPAPPAGSAAGR
jgi:hypothetical protein